ncbi:MAG TPA: ribosomal L7Ae/L30e/S12e/Gadd45 family protein [Clostridia bacterium]|jgi:large subunit ribosomal protein L7A|nr:ribosomal L7Ae/L30e/S12e/Gadd45 family protein [Clostridia bacterium]
MSAEEKGSVKQVAGLRQVIKGIKEQKISAVILALNADEHILTQVKQICTQNEIPLSFTRSKEELGVSLGLEVPCAVVGVLK